MADAPEIPDTELLRRVIASMSRRSGLNRFDSRPLWATVMDRFGLGSTYAWQLCQRFDFDPDQMVQS